jgi:hypothetical protein
MNARHDGLSTKVHAEKLLCLPHTDPGCCRIWGRRFQVIADASSCAIARVGTRIPNCSRAAASTTCLLHSLDTVEFTNHFRPFLGDNFSREPEIFRMPDVAFDTQHAAFGQPHLRGVRPGAGLPICATGRPRPALGIVRPGPSRSLHVISSPRYSKV